MASFSSIAANKEVFFQEQGAHLLLVKNTFLDVDEAPDPEAVRRSFTAPPLGRTSCMEYVDDDSCSDSSHCDIGTWNESAGLEDGCQSDEGACVDISAVPEMLEIGRLRTATLSSYELHEEWAWAAHSDRMQDPMLSAPMQPLDSFVMYPVACPQIISMVPVMMAPISLATPTNFMMVPGDFGCAPAAVSAWAEKDDVGNCGDASGSASPSGSASRCPGGSAGCSMIGSLLSCPDLQTSFTADATSIPWSLPAPQTLTAAQSLTSNCFRVHWDVDARKLTGNDKRAVSPPFSLFLGPDFSSVPFRILLHPKVMNEAKGGSCFRKARGKGFVQLKCEQKISRQVSDIAVRISIGSSSRKQPFRGPIRHSFFSQRVVRPA